MHKRAMFERDILYPTQKIFEPGSVHVTVYQPDNTGIIPIVIEAKTEHNPTEYIQEILSILQTDIFDRIRINIKTNGLFYFKPYYESSPPCRVKFSDKDNYDIEEILDIDLLLDK